MFILFSLDIFPEEEPCIFEIEKVTHVNKEGEYKFASRVTLWYNTTPPQPVIDGMYHLRKICGQEQKEPDRKKPYRTDDLWAQFYRNGEPVATRLSTLYGYTFIPSHHYGIQTINGREMWDPNGRITVDFTDGTFRPGDTVRVEIYSKSEERLISADSYDIAAV
ncbi:hypothetical protein [Methanofollis formosanus]|nr:hypothetical protein [Methanofollis formosanus]